MKKLVRSLLLAGIIVIVLFAMAAFLRGDRDTPEAEGGFTTAPSRMLKMGPVADGVISTETIGHVVIRMEASRIWFKKSKIFGFDNALFKKLAASDFRLTVSREGEELIDLRKDLVEMSADQEIIEIDNPQITFPPDAGWPDSVRLDKQNMSVSIRKGGFEEIWDLAKM